VHHEACVCVCVCVCICICAYVCVCICICVCVLHSVGIMSTGDELIQMNPSSSTQSEIGIYDCNRGMLMAAVRELNPAFVVLDLGHQPDQLSALSQALLRAIERCDLILTSGGVSMGR
jgi:molybdopterin biosynthesis enzyme